MHKKAFEKGKFTVKVRLHSNENVFLPILSLDSTFFNEQGDMSCAHQELESKAKYNFCKDQIQGNFLNFSTNLLQKRKEKKSLKKNRCRIDLKIR